MDRYRIDMDVHDLFRTVRLVQDPVERVAALDVLREVVSRHLCEAYGEATTQAQRAGRVGEVYATCALTPRHMRRMGRIWRLSREGSGDVHDLSAARVLPAVLDRRNNDPRPPV